MLTKNYGRVKLHPDNKRYEATQPAMVTADQIHRVAYEELVEELRYHLSKSEDEPVPVFPFGYDWRHPLGLIEE